MITAVRSHNFLFNYIILFIIFIACVYHSYEKNIYRTLQKTLNLIIVYSTFLMSCCVLYKFRLLVEESFYIKTDYNGNIYSLITATFNFNKLSWNAFAVILFAFMLLLINLNYNIIQVLQRNPIANALALSFSLLLLFSIDIFDCRAIQVSRVFSSGGLDPGTAMACSYFYGYLKIVLPASGGLERAGILTALEVYEAKHGITIPVKKLFILIPSSSYIPPDLREVSDNWMEHSGALDTIAIDRAGVKNRTYHNTIYLIRPGGSKMTSLNFTSIYLAAEGATPLKTFLEVQDKSHRYASVYREYNKEIIRNFYSALQNLLNDNPDCKDYCELVYYEDTIAGQRVNPAHILLERIATYS